MLASRRGHGGVLLATALIGTIALAGLSAAILSLLVAMLTRRSGCATSAAPAVGSVVLGPPGTGQLVGASEYGGPGDRSSGTIGADGQDLLTHPDSYAELGGLTLQTATDMGGLPYMTPLRITFGGRSAIAYKRDFGLGGGPVAGLPRVIDLWWELALGLGIPYEHGFWSGPVRIERPPAAGAGNVLEQVAEEPDPEADDDPVACAPAGGPGVPLTGGERATLLPDGLAAAPRDAPAAVKEIIAAGNEIVGKPYVYGAGHGLPLSAIAPAYDCSSSVEHLLYGARLLPVTDAAASSALESFGEPGPGRWVTLYASADHVFMYVAGLRWDTHDAAGPGDGSTGIGWHPLVRTSDGFVARHPAGL